MIKKQTNIQVSVVIPNWNGKELTKVCLDSLSQQTFKSFEIIVVDNGSTDGSVEFIKKNYPKVNLIELSTNTGFAPAVNIGIKNSQGKYIALINNDTEVDKNCLKYLVSAINLHSTIGFVAAKMLNFYDRKIIDSAGDYIDAVGHANNIGLGQEDGPEFKKAGFVFLVTGGGSLIKKEVFNKVGLLDEDYFAYFEDIDWCFRAQLQGIKGWYEPKAVIYHVHKATSSRRKEFTEYLQFRNMTQTIIKDFPGTVLKTDWNWLKILLVNLNTILYLTSKGFFLQALKADLYVLTHIFTLLKKRIQIQKTKKVSDEYIIKNIRSKKITMFGFLKQGI